MCVRGEGKWEGGGRLKFRVRDSDDFLIYFYYKITNGTEFFNLEF